MPEGAVTADAAELLRLAVAEPRTARARADRLLAASTDPWTLSLARHVRGLVLREQGRLVEAVSELRWAARLAQRSSDVNRLADVRATLGAALILDGRPRAGLAQLDRAVEGAEDPRVRATVRMRRGVMLSTVLARHDEALPDLRSALSGARRLGDRLWEARTLSNLSLLYLDTGKVAQATQALEDARRYFESEGQEVEAVRALHNQGALAFDSGDLPGALRLYHEAGLTYARWGPPPVELGRDRCQALLAAGLPDEAAAVAADLLARERVEPVLRADVELFLALAQLARGQAQTAVAAARSARASFRRQGREVAAARAELVLLTARHWAGPHGARLTVDAERLARTLEAARSEDAPVAWLLAARAAADSGREDTAGLLTAAARYRRHPSGLVRATAWLAEALDRDRRGDVRALLHACRRGLDALDDHRATLGSTELRAMASRRGDELASLALARAAYARPRALLWWSERWRATALTQPALRPPDDDELAGLLAALRANDRRLAEARDSREPVTVLERERSRLEKAIQHRRRLVGASVVAAAARDGLDVDRLVEQVGDGSFVELVDVGGQLRSVVVSSGRVRAYVVGSTADAAAASAAARFVLRQAARGRPVSLADIGLRLQQALLGSSVAALRPGSVVVSPTAALHATPWGLLPALTGAPMSVVPTASTWLRARDRPGAAGTVLVTGPGLATGGAEVPRVAAERPEAVVLADGSATVERCLHAMDGAGLVHVAAHGRFRADNPMFSALELADGPLTVHDLEQLRRAPHRMVLSACDSGVMVPIGAGELLGLASALMSMGTAGILSSVAPVNDEATAELMVLVHRGLDELDDLGAVMQQVREQARGDVVSEATAASFVALGV